MATHQGSSFLPQDLAREVLVRLPVKSLMKFKYVCKEWFTLIGDPEFAKSQLQLSLPAGGIGIVYDQARAGMFSYLNADLESGFDSKINFNVGEIVGDSSVIAKDSCNGLLLLEGEFSCFEGKKQYYVCNPITRWYMKLPPLLLYDDAYRIYRSSLSYDSLNQKYKVLIILEELASRYELNWGQLSRKCVVITLGNKDGDGDGDVDVDDGDGNSSRLSQWRELDFPVISGEISVAKHPIDGAMYWMIRKGPWKRPCILQMELASENFSLIDSPVVESPPTIPWGYRICKMKGSLCLAICVSYDQLDLWVLNDAVEQTWSKEFNINCQLMIDAANQAWSKEFMSVGIPLFRDRHDKAGAFCFSGLYFVTDNPRPVIIFSVCFTGLFLFYDLVTRQFKLDKKNVGVNFGGCPVSHVNSFISF